MALNIYYNGLRVGCLLANCGGFDIFYRFIHKVGKKTLETPERFTRPLEIPEMVMTQDWLIFVSKLQFHLFLEYPEEMFFSHWTMLSERYRNNPWVVGAGSNQY